MLRLSKKTEYAIMAVQYIAEKNGSGAATAREISESYAIPYDFVSKVLQKLSKIKIINSFQGVKGGYCLSRKPEEISLIEIIQAIEPSKNLTKCLKEKASTNDCLQFDRCRIRDPLAKIQYEIDKVFRNTMISHIL